MTNDQRWRAYWPATFPSDLDRTFIVDEDSQTLYSTITGELLVGFKEPPRTVPEVAHHAFELGAVLVDKWDLEWGTAAALSLPGSVAAWFLVDDYEKGRFESIGVRFIENIGFGYPVGMYFGDETQAARFAISYGIRRERQQLIEKLLSLQPPFPTKNKKMRKFWGPTDVLEYETLNYGLYYLQRLKGLGPTTAMAASKTAEVMYEQHT